MRSIENPLQKVIKGRSCGHSVVRGMYNGPFTKKVPKNLASNYRPVSITSVICKLMESIIRDHIVVHMSDNSLFANEQHGFVPRRECMTNLLSAMEDWSEAIELGLDTDVVKTISQWNRRRRIIMDSIIFHRKNAQSVCRR